MNTQTDQQITNALAAEARALRAAMGPRTKRRAITTRLRRWVCQPVEEQWPLGECREVRALWPAGGRGLWQFLCASVRPTQNDLPWWDGASFLCSIAGLWLRWRLRLLLRLPAANPLYSARAFERLGESRVRQCGARWVPELQDTAPTQPTMRPPQAAAAPGLGAEPPTQRANAFSAPRRS